MTAPRTLSILLAEDDPISQLVAVGLLEQFGHRVAVVGDGRSAVASIASGRRFDVILMDLFMPELDGVAAAREIRASSGALRDIPIVALTASTMHTDIEAAGAAGMNAVVAKPFDAARLNAILMQLTGERDTTGSSRPDCDSTVVEQLHDALGRDAVDAAIQSFIASLGGHAADLETLLASDPDRALALAHRLAGSSAVFGLRRLSLTFLEIERALRAGDIAPARAQLPRLPDLTRAAVQHLPAATSLVG